jgi:hypothetical protein
MSACVMPPPGLAGKESYLKDPGSALVSPSPSLNAPQPQGASNSMASKQGNPRMRIEEKNLCGSCPRVRNVNAKS